MSNYFKYITSMGVIVPDTSTVLEDVQSEWRALFGTDLDVSPETPQGRMIEEETATRIFCIQIVAMISNMLNLGKAYGFVLDDLGALFLLYRKPATYTQVAVTMNGVPGTLIPAGTRLQSTADNIFATISDATIAENGSVVVYCQAQETGPIPAVAESITVILDAVNGLETVINNTGPTQLGQEQESDNVFRNRIRTSLNVNSIAIISAIKSALENLEGVSGSYCYDNYGDVATVIDGVSVPAHSILAVVDGGDTQEIAQVLFNKKTIGTGYVAEPAEEASYAVITETVVDDYGNQNKVRFMRPILQPVDIKITVRRQNYSGENLTDAITTAIVDFANGENPEVDGVVIGGSLSPFEIAAAVSSVIPDIFISNVEIGNHGSSLSSATMTFGEIHKAEITAENITVNITEDAE